MSTKPDIERILRTLSEILSDRYKVKVIVK